MTGASDTGGVPNIDAGIEHRPDALVALARQRLVPEIFDFAAGGAGDEAVLRDNVAAWQRHRLRPRVLQGVEDPDLTTTVLGRRLTAPLFVCPMGRQRLVHPDGERASAAAAATAGVGYVLSAASSVPMAEIAPAAGPAPWFQLYVPALADAGVRLVRHAEDAGFAAIWVTVDAPVVGLRLRALRYDGSARAAVTRADVDSDTARPGYLADANKVALTWRDIGHLRTLTPLPIVVKGILTAEDAAAALEAGVDGVVVSNHGGRQLARVAATADALPEVVETIAHRLPVFVDGGVRSASDVVTAISLGASAVGIGRHLLWALACGGQPLVERALDGLIADLRRTMILLGRRSLADLGPSAVERPDPTPDRRG